MDNRETCCHCGASGTQDDMWPINLHGSRWLCHDCYDRCAICSRPDVDAHHRDQNGTVCIDCFVETSLEELLSGPLTSEQHLLVAKIKACLVEQKGRRHAA